MRELGTESFNKKKELDITSDSSNTTGMSDFPALIHIVDGDDQTTGTGTVKVNWNDFEETDGADFRVFDSDESTLLDYGFEKWDDTNTEAWIWVRTPVMDRDGSDSIWLAYGQSGATDSQNMSGVWKNFLGVYLFNESSGDLIDVSSNNEDFTVNGSPTRNVSGVIDDGYDFTPGNGDYCGTHSLGTNFSQITTEIWFNSDDLSIDYQGLISQEDWAEGIIHFKIEGPSGDFPQQITADSQVGDKIATGSIYTDNDYYTGYRVSGPSDGEFSIFKNGTVISTGSAGTANVDLDSTKIADEYTDGRRLDGIISHVRMSDTERSDAFIEASHDMTSIGDYNLFSQNTAQTVGEIYSKLYSDLVSSNEIDIRRNMKGIDDIFHNNDMYMRNVYLSFHDTMTYQENILHKLTQLAKITRKFYIKFGGA